MELFTLIKIKEFVEQRIHANCVVYYPEPDFDSEVNGELWKIRAFLATEIEKAEKELDHAATL
jgi:hypothetical protein